MRQRKISNEEMGKNREGRYPNKTSVTVQIPDTMDHRQDALLEIKRISK